MRANLRDLQILTLGGLAISLGNGPAPKLVSRKAEALLVYLACTAQEHSREVLADMLWDERTQQQALGNLRVVLTSLRREFGDYLEITRSSVVVKQDPAVWLDVHHLEQGIRTLTSDTPVLSLHAAARAEEALTLYRGEFLQNFYIRDAEGFEDWMRQERERITRLVSDALIRLTEIYSQSGNNHKAISTLRRLLLVDPYSEIAHLNLIQILHQNGYRPEAIAQYREYEKLLNTELQIEPSPQAIALYEEIRTAGHVAPSIKADQLFVRFPGHKLPTYPTSFVGRENELSELVKLLQHQDSRLVTLLGPGGVGKTRLALRLAHEVSDQFEGGVVFVDLAPISKVDLVPSKIAKAFGIRPNNRRALIEDIKKRLGTRRLLLVLDNFEQVIDAAPLIAELIAALPHLCILVTSRECLRIYGELEYWVKPLAVPEQIGDEQLPSLMGYESVALFVQRAQASDPGFRLTEENARDIAAICIRLDGLPLAIELAAARVKIFKPRHLLAQLSDSLANLTDGSRDVSARHQTLHGAIVWSYQLLEKDEKTLFTRLAVFRGGCTLEAAEHVCGHGLEQSVTALLASLFNKSLIQSQEDSNGELRFFTLETIQQFARTLLAQNELAQTIYERHANYYLALAQKAEPELRGAKQEAWSRRLRADYDNMLEALNWCFSGVAVQIGLRLVGALSEFWYYEGSHADGMQWLSRALKEADDAPPEVYVKLLNSAGMVAFASGNHEEGRQYNSMALTHARAQQDLYNCAWAQFWLSAHATTDPTRYQEGLEFIENALTQFHEIDDQSGLAWGCNQLGEVTRLMQDYKRAQAAYLKSIEICRTIGHRRREGIALVNLSYVFQQQGEYGLAEREAQQGLSILSELELHYHAAIAMTILVGPLSSQGKPIKAARLYSAAQAQFERIGNHLQPADQIEIDRYITAVREQLDHDIFNKSCIEGRNMPFKEAVAYALKGSD